MNAASVVSPYEWMKFAVVWMPAISFVAGRGMRAKKKA